MQVPLWNKKRIQTSQPKARLNAFLIMISPYHAFNLDLYDWYGYYDYCNLGINPFTAVYLYKQFHNAVPYAAIVEFLVSVNLEMLNFILRIF